jgi:hypothetical protein
MQDSYEGTECIPILICVCGPESGDLVVDRSIDESNCDMPARYAGPPTSPLTTKNDPRWLAVPSYDGFLAMGVVIDHR